MDFWQKLDIFLNHAGTIVALVSAIVGVVNHRIRKAQENGQELSPAVLHAAAIANVAAVNIDKTMQLLKLAKDKKLAGAKSAEIAAVVTSEVIEMIEPDDLKEAAKPEV